MEPALMKSVIVSQPLISEDARKVREVLIERGLETPLIDNGLNRDQRLSTPVLGDKRKQPMFNLVPFACAWREMTDDQR